MRGPNELSPLAVPLFLALVGLTAVGRCADSASGARANALYREIHEPRIVAVPPTYAVRDLCLLGDGRIRHYGRDRGRPVYIESCDLGLSWTTHLADPRDPGAMVRSPWSGEWVGLLPGGHGEKLRAVRSKTGPGDVAADVREIAIAECDTREPLPLVSRRRWIVPLSDISGRDETYHAAVAISDDDGRTWRRVDPPRGVELPAGAVAPDEIPRWRNDACEPTVVELADGELLMAVRTSIGLHYLYRSKDAGDSWTGPEPMEGFHATGTMPFFLRLRDGRILFVWNNCEPLPRRWRDVGHPITADERRGRWETVFTNRDALHAAISEDGGRTWRGFRELILNPIRNRPDFREYLRKGAENDKSVHQVQGLELPDGKVMLAAGQNPGARRIIVFDPRWLYESDAELDLRDGLEGLSNHLYVRSVTGGCKWGGHCSWERIPGAVLELEPGQEDVLDARESLHVCRIRDPRLVDDRQGVAWNFPASAHGRVETECRVDGEGFRLSLADVWINPCDDVNAAKCAFSERIVAGTLGGAGRWAKLAVDWDLRGKTAVLSVDGREVFRRTLANPPRHGFSYLHVQSLAEGADEKGCWFRGFKKTAKGLDRGKRTER